MRGGLRVLGNTMVPLGVLGLILGLRPCQKLHLVDVYRPPLAQCDPNFLTVPFLETTCPIRLLCIATRPTVRHVCHGGMSGAFAGALRLSSRESCTAGSLHLFVRSRLAVFFAPYVVARLVCLHVQQSAVSGFCDFALYHFQRISSAIVSTPGRLCVSALLEKAGREPDRRGLAIVWHGRRCRLVARR
jgi:hypothetical protein